MTEFLIALAALIAGYVIYSRVCARVFGVDPKRKMPAETRYDGVDFMPLPTWKVFLIQFLNIAGLGPIFGAIMGVKFGPAAFIWIVAGTIFAGAVHDFMSGMMSIRGDGASLPEIIGRELGMTARQLMNVVSVVLLILVGAVFILTPADLIAGMTPASLNTTFWICAIFAYYILATLLPIDKLIGNFYPVFGLALLFMAVGVGGYIIFGPVELNIDMASESSWHVGSQAVFPMMFVSIACGAISGFHATQSPMMARCLKNERLARPIFYGAMVAEGIVALIWAAAAIAFTGGYQGLNDYMADGGTAGSLVHDISLGWLGTAGGILALFGVIAAPITTGDTALRSARLITADFFKVGQSKFTGRLLVSLPLFALTFAVMMIDYNILWRYFAWVNQTLSVFTLWAITVWLARHRKAYVISLVPALFMTIICVSYIFYAPSPEGFGLPLAAATGIAAAVAVASVAMFIRYLRVSVAERIVKETL